MQYLITVGYISDAYKKTTLQQPAVLNLPIHASIAETHFISLPAPTYDVSFNKCL